MKTCFSLLLALHILTLHAHDGEHLHMEPNTHPPTGDAFFDLAVVYINQGNAEALRAMLEVHPELITQRAKGHEEYERGYFKHPTLLHFTAFNPWWNEDTKVPPTTPEVVEVLIEAGAEVDAICGESDNEWTTLGLVTSGGKTNEAGVEPRLIEILVENGANTTNGFEGAVIYQDWESADQLIALGAEKTPVVLAYQNDAPALKKALAEADQDTKQKALFTAVVKGNLEATQVALDAGANPSAFMPSPFHPGTTAVHQAAWFDQVEILKLLLANGGSAVLRDKNYDGTPLNWAGHAHNDECLEILLEVTPYEVTPQQMAAWGLDERLQKVIDADPKAANAVGDWGAPLQQAAYHGQVSTVELLIANGADVNQTAGGKKVPGDGVTALDKALTQNLGGTGTTLEERAACAKILRAHGAKTGEELEAEQG